jgi:hypothetical protein
MRNESGVKAVSTESCVNCGNPLTGGEGPGRPDRYCSIACKRQAEHELRRLERHLEAVERDLREARLRPESHDWTGASFNVRGLEAELANLKQRERELLDDATEGGEGSWTPAWETTRSVSRVEMPGPQPGSAWPDPRPDYSWPDAGRWGALDEGPSRSS